MSLFVCYIPGIITSKMPKIYDTLREKKLLVVEAFHFNKHGPLLYKICVNPPLPNFSVLIFCPMIST